MEATTLGLLADKLTPCMAHALNVFRQALLREGVEGVGAVKPTGRWAFHSAYSGQKLVIEVIHDGERVLIDERGMVVGNKISDYFKEVE